ncbi:DUF998 domain-containing protein [Clavibacter zhangzhiyongii]|uniref:DUF998 domain-containing protein n=1 Tax=Clavibacter zhangzhiyongii TaxID=2768071 RepID=UPI0039DFC85D
MSTRPDAVPAAAGVAWIAAAVVYVGTEAVAASAFPGYSYSANYISDLGVPEVAEFQGRTIDSPLAAVMNAGFVLQGVLYLVAAAIATRALRTGPRRAFLALAALHAVGIIVVGLIHGSAASDASGIGWLHVVGAGLAIISGNVASIVAGAGSRRIGAPARSASRASPSASWASPRSSCCSRSADPTSTGSGSAAPSTRSPRGSSSRASPCSWPLAGPAPTDAPQGPDAAAQRRSAACSASRLRL